ncbi:MAG: FkbM family methyltransferase [Ignavibacteriae bacterium]|nr:MAG: FkbM family methyltransferase [Ignavibacteriota bacterium]
MREPLRGKEFFLFREIRMKFFNRDFSLIARHAYHLPSYPAYFLKCFSIFKRPTQIISCYLRMTPPPTGVVDLRSGLTVHLSSHPHDIVTIFIIFIRGEYGRISPGSTVIDIGANIGAFSLFAASCGASKVFAFEPNAEAFQCLQKNIHANRLDSVIKPHRFAVAGSAGRRIRFPKNASAYNSFLRGESAKEYEFVKTIDLTRIMKNIDHVDLLKMDCEGAEWEILHGTNREVLDRIDAIRMEYHLGQRDQIAAFLQQNGFSLKMLAGPKYAGNMWLDKL